ncbi:MAG TPA: asparaginase, partial [Acidimicrobiia bacterium]
MLARVIRSGLIEAEHRGALAVVTASGEIKLASGDVRRPFFFRSAAKPFQATVAQEAGAGLSPEQMAVACGSHFANPVQVAIVCQMLDEAGMSAADLRCPPAWPLSEQARNRLVAAGATSPDVRWHNCSGKHAAMLRACRARGWPTASYLEESHPLQRRITEFLQRLTGEQAGPVGTDGCGLPVHRVSVLGLAAAYARLGSEPSMRQAWSAMSRFPPLTSDTDSVPARLATWTDAAAKSGAEGCLGLAQRGGVGVAVKVWD